MKLLLLPVLSYVAYATSNQVDSGVVNSNPDRFDPCAWGLCEPCSFTLTKVKMEQIKVDLRRILFADRLAHALRLSFHDCVGGSGCDGCINTRNPRNAGPMLGTLAVMDSFYDANGYRAFLSRADFYALAGIAAVEIAIDNNNNDCRNGVTNYPCQVIAKPTFDFQYCRRECPTSPFTNFSVPNFPPGHSNHSETLDFFRWEFGLQTDEAVALLGGGHSLGGASASATGFIGKFKGDDGEANRFNNNYFRFLLDSASIDYRLVNKQQVTNFSTPRWQWDGFRNGRLFNFMLNTDVSLVHDITTNPSGMSTCSPLEQCGLVASDESALNVAAFANDVDAFLRTFARAFVKMINTGHQSYQLRTPL